MKKLVSLLLAVVLLLSLMLPAAATTIYPPIDWPIILDDGENGYTYTLTETEEGNVLSDVRYVSSEKDAYVPKTLGGVAVTSDNLDGKTFYYGKTYVRSFTVDEDNEFFSVSDGVLLTKDCKTLVYYPEKKISGVCRLPDGVESIGAYSFYTGNGVAENEQSLCFVIPASVTEISADAFAGRSPVLAGEAGSEAERFSEENGLTFIVLGEEHTHAYFRTEVPATCTESGKVLVVCPCGETASSEEIKPLGHDWRERTVEKEDGKSYFEIYCSACGEIKLSRLAGVENGDVCSCRCHKINRTWAIELTKDNWQEVLRNVIFRFKLAVWHLSGTHQVCECGMRHY